MSKCFITKLPSSVDNDNLPVLGQLRIKWLKQNNLEDNDSRAIGLQTIDSITVKVSGAHFTNNTLTSNDGNTKTITADNGFVWMYISNDSDAVLTIDNKYSLSQLSFIKPFKEYSERLVFFDIEDIKYCTNLTALAIVNAHISGDISALSNLTNLAHLSASSTQLSGDVSALSNLTNLGSISLNNTQVSGNISAVSNLTKLTSLGFENTLVSGDISAVSNLTNLTRLRITGTQINGNISAISNLTKLQEVNFNNMQISGNINALSNLTNVASVSLNNTQVSGNVNSLANLTKLTRLDELKGLSLTGDMSKIPTKVCGISQIYRTINTNFTWTANGRQNATLLAMEGYIPFDTTSMDNMLIDQATCTFTPIEHAGWTKVISVNGTRTSASDAAVATLQSKGVTITGVTKAS